MLDTDFEPKLYGKTNRLKGMQVTITEKLDGTNGTIFIEGDKIGAQSRSRILQAGKVDGKDMDNFAFASWVEYQPRRPLQTRRWLSLRRMVWSGYPKEPNGLGRETVLLVQYIPPC